MRRITYWTGNWNPGREAISNEIESLRDVFGWRNPVVSLSSGQASGVDLKNRVITLNGNRWMTYRALAAVIEPLGDVTHAFGAIDAWHPLRSLGRRPFVYTVVAPGRPLAAALYDRVSMFAAESEPLAAQLEQTGVPRARIRVIYPGVDLSYFSPAPLPPPEPFRLLFASTPSDPAEFEARGIPLLIDLARQRRDIEVVMAWRRWGDETRAKAALAALAPPPNVQIHWGDVADMRDLYHSVHATVVCFADGAGKSCPNSVIEGMACGRPVLLTDTCGIATLVRDRSAGVVVNRSADALAAGVDELLTSLVGHAASSRVLSQDAFDLAVFRAGYRILYEAVT